LPDTTRGALGRFQDVCADLGWRGILRAAPQWVVYRRYLGLVVDLRDLEPARERRPEIRVTVLEGADLPAVSALHSVMTCQEVARRLAEGQQCLLGWWGPELAHYRWDTTWPAYLPYLGRVLQPRRGEQVVVGIYTAPAFRGRGIASAVMFDAIERARVDGVSRQVWLAAWWNTRSLGLAVQVASTVVGTVGYWALGPCRRYFATGQVRFESDGSVGFDATESTGR
jgi:GNAT superfamily N-acetyltransferase